MLTSHSTLKICLILGLGFVAVGCGKDGSSSSNSPSPAPATTADTSIPTIPAASTTPIATTPTTCTAPPQNLFYDRIVQLTNAERQKNNLAILQLATPLINAAQAHAEDMAAKNYFGHTSLDGSTVGDRLRRNGYTSAGGENIAAGYDNPDSVFQGWMASPGHRSNILGNWREIGVGFANQASSSYGTYWVQNFGAGNSATSPTSAVPSSATNCQTVATGRSTIVLSAGSSQTINESRIWVGSVGVLCSLVTSRYRRSRIRRSKSI
jgi:uncharacterized protein YkwD